MYFNSSEFMLLSRGGRVPAATRAGPPVAVHAIRDTGGRRRLAGWTAGLFGSRVLPAPRALSRPPAPVHRSGLERESYLELEFAVGFHADDQPWS